MAESNPNIKEEDNEGVLGSKKRKFDEVEEVSAAQASFAAAAAAAAAAEAVHEPVFKPKEDSDGSSAAATNGGKTGGAGGGDLGLDHEDEEEMLDDADPNKVTVRAMSNPEVFFMLNDALENTKREASARGGSSMAGKWREIDGLKDIIRKISPFLAAPERFARANSLKADLEKWSAKSEDGGPPKRLTDRHVAMFTNFKFDDPGEYLELCRNTAERTYFTNDELIDIIEIVNRACEDQD